MGNTQMFFCDGNHEDHDSLETLQDLQVYPNVYYMQRGTTLKLPDGRVVLFAGGARSVDAHMRTPGVDWFENETLSPRDVAHLEDIKIDIIISHTCPVDFNIDDPRIHGADPSRIVLSLLLHRFKPSLWYFGHYHHYQTGEVDGCKWTCVPQIGMQHWAEPLAPAAK